MQLANMLPISPYIIYINRVVNNTLWKYSPQNTRLGSWDYNYYLSNIYYCRQPSGDWRLFPACYCKTTKKVVLWFWLYYLKQPVY